MGREGGFCVKRQAVPCVQVQTGKAQPSLRCPWIEGQTHGDGRWGRDGTLGSSAASATFQSPGWGLGKYHEQDRHRPCFRARLNVLRHSVSNRGRAWHPLPKGDLCWEEPLTEPPVAVLSSCPAMALLCGLRPGFALSVSLEWVGEALSTTLFTLSSGESGVIVGMILVLLNVPVCFLTAFM